MNMFRLVCVLQLEEQTGATTSSKHELKLRHVPSAHKALVETILQVPLNETSPSKVQNCSPCQYNLHEYARF